LNGFGPVCRALSHFIFMSKTILEVRDLSKLYRLGEVGTGTLSHDLNRWWARVRGKDDPYAIVGQANRRDQKAESAYIWALKDVSFDVREGEILGIIGANGSGKSTLLKLISRITSPTTGGIRAKGHIASLLEVGTGMHLDMTARENIYLNGAILGMKRHEITRRFADIVDFSGCQMYVDTPVKRFSSGMRVRLGFAVAAFLEPEILIVDEVLAVADVSFQRQCLGRMQDLSNRSGRTVLLVSHNSTALASLCHRGILLKQGQTAFDGSITEAIHHYSEATTRRRVHWSGPIGNDDFQLVETWIRPVEENGIWETGTALEVGAVLDVQRTVDSLYFGFRLLSGYGTELALALYDDADSEINQTIHPCRISQRWIIPANMLAAGQYRIDFTLGLENRSPTLGESSGELLFELENLTGHGRQYHQQGVRGSDSLLRPNWVSDRRVTTIQDHNIVIF